MDSLLIIIDCRNVFLSSGYIILIYQTKCEWKNMEPLLKQGTNKGSKHQQTEATKLDFHSNKINGA